MRIILRAASVAFLAVCLGGVAVSQEIKIGVIAPFSGPFASYGRQFQQAIEVYQAQNGTAVAGQEIEIIYMDSGGVDPDNAKALAQELIIREQVDYLAGFVFTPNALAVASLIEQSQTPTVIFNAATSIITEQSDYFVRSSFTLWQVTVPMADWAYDQGVRSVVTSVSDYGPGLDAANAFKSAFEARGGQVVDEIRMPLSTTDFAPFMQRIKDGSPDAVFGFLPVGPPTFSFIKSYNENGLAAAGITFYGTGETDETTLDALGDSAIGTITAYHYSAAHESALNAAFTAKMAEMFPQSITNFASVGAYDGMHVLYAMIAVDVADLAEGEDDSAARIEAIKGMAWESPRGPVSIDPETRHIIQNVYIREVVKQQDGGYINREFMTIEAVPDLGLAQN